ncbi:MAG: HIT domain-containing protein [Crocinitomicaceae bacterium]|jgi:histidine triad (HIT) family protein|nr:HIT domain-containing protein [Crocinitomicaceae bacterium]
MSSLFTKIIKGEIPCYKIAEDDSFLAFLDINPLMRGHALVIPKVEIDYLFDIDDDVLQNMIIFAKNVASKIKNAIPCDRVGVSVIGLEVPHAHIHLIPISKIDDMNFNNSKLALSSKEMINIQQDIIGHKK